MLVKRRHPDLALLLLLSLAAVQVWNIRLSMEYQPAFLLTGILLPLYLHFERKGEHSLTVLSVIGGTAVAFFDFLTTETVTILLPLALVIAVRAKEKRLGPWRQNLPMIFRCGAAWLVSYVAAFIVKWTAASILGGYNAFAAALGSAGTRMVGTVAGVAETPDSFLSAPLANLNMLFGSPLRVNYGWIFGGLILASLVLFSLWFLLHGKKRQPDAAVLLWGLGCMVLLRFLILNNHAYLHCFFTYRALVTLIFAALAALWFNIELPHEQKRRHK